MKYIKKVIILIVAITICFLIPFFLIEKTITNGIFGLKPFYTSFSESEWFSFVASYLGAIGSIMVGVIALYQNGQYKKQSEKHAHEIDELMLLPEIYPTNITTKNGITDLGKSSYVYCQIDGENDRCGENKIYAIEFIVIKNPVIELKVASLSADYYQGESCYSNKNRSNNSKEHKVDADCANMPSYNPVDSTFTIALGLPKVNGNIKNPAQIPDIIKVKLKIKYKNQYDMCCEKIIDIDLDEKKSRGTDDNGVYPTLVIKQARITGSEK